jgi:hypothetical protein
MKKISAWYTLFLDDKGSINDITWLILLALARILFQVFINGQYGIHRDEFGTLDAARDLAWGYVAYPPLTPFIARLALDWFGPSIIGLRFFSLLAQGMIMLLAGLMVRELGGSRWVQILTSLAVGLSPISIIIGGLLQYVTFDQLWWVSIAYMVIHLLKSGNPRWWLGIGTVIGLGVLTKYTIAYCVAGLAVGLLATRNWRYIKSPWLWGGAGLALLISLPNLIWLAQNHWITLEFLNSIHNRDVLIGRADGFLLDQLKFNSVPVLLFLVFGGLYFYFFAPGGKRYQAIGWMYVVPLILFFISKGRGYYLAPTYPMLIAGGAVWWDQLIKGMNAKQALLWQRITWGFMGAGLVVILALTLPVAPVGSAWWKVVSGINGDLKEEVGWPEFVQTVAGIYRNLPDAEKPAAAILAGNCGEAGAINLYGPAYGLPKPISGFNSYWHYGYGKQEPQTVIVVGMDRDFLNNFETCQLAGQTTNSYHLKNEETLFHPDIYVCRKLRWSWDTFWADFQYFG